MKTITAPFPSAALLHAALLALLFLASPSLHAEIIGLEQFAYPDGAIAARNGGTFWDYKNVPPAGHGGVASAWQNVSGAPTVSAGRLVTNNSSARRTYHPNEPDGAVSGTTVEKIVYYKVTFTTGATLPDFAGLSSYFFATEQVFFGKPFGQPNFGFVKGADTVLSTVAVQPNTTYTLVTKLDYVTNTIRLFINPDLAAPEPVTAAASFTFTAAFNPSTSVRLASGFSGSAVTWDELAVVTTWGDFTTVVTTTNDEDNGSLVQTAGGGAGVSLREAVKYGLGPIAFAPALSGQTCVLTAGELVLPGSTPVTIDASSLPFGITIDGNGSSRLFSVSGGQSLTLRGLTLAGGNGAGTNPSGNGGAVLTFGSLRLIGCTLTGNTATAGGAIYSDTNLTGIDTTLTRCTLTGNRATFSGGALYNHFGRTVLSACTLSGNASTLGGGIVSFADGFTETLLDHTIVSGNTGGDVSLISAGANSYTSQGRNLIGDGNGTGDFNQSGDQTGVTNPKLTPLGYFSGPTMTMHPLIGSPAIDAGSPAAPGGTDQRGFPGFVDGNEDTLLFRDIGAVECGPVAVIAAAGDGAGDTLRNAITLAGGLGTPGARLRFDPAVFPSTITLNGSEIAVPAASKLFIDASNLSGPVTISGNNASRVFNIAPGAIVAMHSLRIVNGKAPDGSNGTNGSNGTDGTDGTDGGGILNAGSLSLISCTVTGNRAGDGGSGGNGSSGVIGVSGGSGGRGGSGGGVFSSGPLTLSACTLSANFAGRGGNGGSGIGSGNGGNGGNGGGIFKADSIPYRLTACSIVGNTAGTGGTGGFGTGPGNDGLGGGISFGSSVLENCLIASNTASDSAPDVNVIALTTRGANLLSTAAFANTTSGPAPIINATPLLAPLDQYGGPTQTMALMPGSPARDAATGSTATTDQRGFPIVGTPDLGAYEAGTLSNYNAFIWETLPATATLAEHAATFDFDGDGATNGDEYLAGTIVTDLASVFRVTNLTFVGNNFSVTFPSVVGRNYALEYSPTLAPGSWLVISGTDRAGTGNPLTISITVGPALPQLFVRPRVGP